MDDTESARPSTLVKVAQVVLIAAFIIGAIVAIASMVWLLVVDAKLNSQGIHSPYKSEDAEYTRARSTMFGAFCFAVVTACASLALASAQLPTPISKESPQD